MPRNQDRCPGIKTDAQESGHVQESKHHVDVQVSRQIPMSQDRCPGIKTETHAGIMSTDVQELRQKSRNQDRCPGIKTDTQGARTDTKDRNQSRLTGNFKFTFLLQHIPTYLLHLKCRNFTISQVSQGQLHKTLSVTSNILNYMYYQTLIGCIYV